jgi:uncharacterized alkaline shock family protein YloU
MNTFNRVLVVVLFLDFIAAAVISIMAMAGYVLALPGSIFSQQLSFLQGLSGWDRVIAIASASVFIVFIAYLIWLELTVGFPEKALLLSSNEKGDIYINRDTVETFAEKVGRQESAQVRAISCYVTQKRKGIVIDCNPTIRLGTSLNSITPRIQARVKQSVQDLLGLNVLNVRVRARYERGGRPMQQELILTRRNGDGSTK